MQLFLKSSWLVLPVLTILNIFLILLMLQFSFLVCMNFVISINGIVCYIKNYENRFIFSWSQKTLQWEPKWVVSEAEFDEQIIGFIFFSPSSHYYPSLFHISVVI